MGMVGKWKQVGNHIRLFDDSDNLIADFLNQSEKYFFDNISNHEEDNRLEKLTDKIIFCEKIA